MDYPVQRRRLREWMFSASALLEGQWIGLTHVSGAEVPDSRLEPFRLRLELNRPWGDCWFLSYFCSLALNDDAPQYMFGVEFTRKLYTAGGAGEVVEEPPGEPAKPETPASPTKPEPSPTPAQPEPPAATARFQTPPTPAQVNAASWPRNSGR